MLNNQEQIWHVVCLLLNNEDYSTIRKLVLDLRLQIISLASFLFLFFLICLKQSSRIQTKKELCVVFEALDLVEIGFIELLLFCL